MKNLTTQLRLVSLLSLTLLAWTAAFGQLTPSADSYTNTADPNTNYGANVASRCRERVADGLHSV